MKNIILTAVLLLVTSTSIAAEPSFSECVSERLQAYNGSVFYALTQQEVIDLLDDSTHVHNSIVKEMARRCLEE